MTIFQMSELINSYIVFRAPNNVSILLVELELPYNVIPVDLDKLDQKKPEFLQLNPNGKILIFTLDTDKNEIPTFKKMKLKLIEPLNELFKDEVRVLGKSLGLDNSILKKHPFTGPGLAIRIVGEITEKK